YPSPRPYVPLLDTRPVRQIYASSLYPNLLVVDKENGGKADALNCGINMAGGSLVCAIDADSVIDSEALAKLREEFCRDGNLVAAGGLVLPANDSTIKAGKVGELRLPRKLLVRLQVLEYLRGFLVGRVAWSQLNALLIISGAFGLFDREAVVRCGGYRHDTVGEDMELVVRMHRVMRKMGRPYSIRFVPEAYCWTEVPDTVRLLSRQRARWYRGLLDSLRFNLSMLANPRYGVVGLAAFPYFVLVEALGPVIELTGYAALAVSLCLGIVDYTFALLFVAVSCLLGTLVSLSAIRLGEDLYFRYPSDSDTWKLVWCAVLDNFGYRQLTVLWRLRGLLEYVRGVRVWGRMERQGFAR
ncbi:MAG: glycosyltransferase family 2 protein, partial [Bacillota bacterium]